MKWEEREKVLSKNRVPLTECRCGDCGKKDSVINKDGGFYCVICESYPTHLEYDLMVIPNE